MTVEMTLEVRAATPWLELERRTWHSTETEMAVFGEGHVGWSRAKHSVERK